MGIGHCAQFLGDEDFTCSQNPDFPFTRLLEAGMFLCLCRGLGVVVREDVLKLVPSCVGLGIKSRWSGLAANASAH